MNRPPTPARRIPWTREQLEALRRLAGEGGTHARIAQALGVSRGAVAAKLWRLQHQPPRRPARSAFEAANAAALYRDGWSPTEIAARFACSKGLVVKHLAAQAVTARRPGRPVGRVLSPLAREIIEDLAGPLGGEASLPRLAEWLGEPDVRLSPALAELRDRGFVTQDDDVYRLAERGRAAVRPR
ncbi:MAG TPA: GcrA family cell cycle regulator [Caulobacteraceae bacterium]|jgi:Mn-dependent DtxR family transcriptional regulator|nr:GcrA family cell cycle regulator [Caulobacteraceae bacterium]